MSGYIRAKQKEFDISIPDDLINLLIRFAGGKDQWDKSKFAFFKDDTKITKN